MRIMGLKEETVRSIGFARLAIFRPGIIAGNTHTPRYAAFIGHLLPLGFGTIDQADIARAFVNEFLLGAMLHGTAYLENEAMRRSARVLG